MKEFLNKLKTPTKILSIVCVVLVLMLFSKCNSVSRLRYDNHQNIEQIDSLNLEVEKLRNQNTQLVTEIDSSNVQIQVIEKWYEKESDIIFNQSTDSNVVFFRGYLSQDNR